MIQTFDTEKKQYISQEFIAGDDVDYEDKEENPVNSKLMQSPDGSEPYLLFDMVQPQDMTSNEDTCPKRGSSMEDGLCSDETCPLSDEHCPYCGSGLLNDKGECQICGL